MGHAEARAWWADVEHLRDDLERAGEARRRGDVSDLSARRASREEQRQAAVREGAGAERQAVVREGPGAQGQAAVRPVAGTQRQARVRPDAGEQVRPVPAPRAAERRTSTMSAYGASSPASARRTVEIRGRPVPAPPPRPVAELERRRPPRRPVERIGARPDRLALWALLMGILLILVAVGTADAALLAR